MKNRIVLLLMAVMFLGLTAEAQNPKAWGRKNYFNVAWVDQTLKNSETGLKWKSDFGVSLVKGTTYYLHSKPLFGMLKFGIDWTQVDLNYAKLKEDFVIPESEDDGGLVGDILEKTIGDIDLGKHQLEYSMHVGPSVTVNPVDHLKINAYFRYAPSFSALIYEDLAGDTQFGSAYGSFFVTGGAVSWKLISLGAEYRWGQGKYKTYSFDADEVEDLDVSEVITSSKQKMKTSSLRLYVSLRF